MRSDSGIHTLLADSIVLSFGKRNVLNGAWLHSSTGTVTGVLGCNGSGKSTMFRTVMGQLKAHGCHVQIDGETVLPAECRFAPAGLLRGNTPGRHIKYLPQGQFLPDRLTLGEVFGYFGMDYGRFSEEFPEFSRYHDIRVRSLSPGEIRIAEIWLALCSQAPFCILDEPFSFLAPVIVERIQALIMRFKPVKGIVVSDHNYRALLGIADEVLLLADGYVHLVRDSSDLVRYGYIRG